MSRFQQLREMHNGPPVNLEEIIRGLDIELDKRASLRDEISGILERMADGYRILVNSNQHYFRQRFTMAHELAHYLLHLDLIGDGIADDKVFRSKDTGIYKNSLITEKHERSLVYQLMQAISLLSPEPHSAPSHIALETPAKTTPGWKTPSPAPHRAWSFRNR